jgi:hypothetical protein
MPFNQRPIVFDEDDDGIQIEGCPSKGKMPQPCTVKRDYYTQALLFHPDKNPACKDKSNKKFKDLATTSGCKQFTKRN